MMRYRPHRYQTQFPIALRTPSGPQRGEVLDVNNAGARIAGLHNLQQGDTIELELLSDRIEAIVQWACGTRAGVTFRPRITNRQLDMLRFRPDRPTTVGRGTVGFGFAELRHRPGANRLTPLAVR